jgi:hypothetical protein
VYGARQMQCKRSVTCASFEDLKWWVGPETSGRGIDVDIEQGNYEVGIRRIYLRFVSLSLPSGIDTVYALELQDAESV